MTPTAKYLPMSIVKQTNELGRESFAVRYADGRVIHKGYTIEGAQRMAEKITRLLQSNPQFSAEG